jgi:predicted metal-binding membrane protein
MPLALPTFASLAAGWLLMMVAMMSPVLIEPVRQIRRRSFTHRRARAIALFAIGYAAIWMVVGGLLMTIALAMASFTPQPYVAAAVVACLAAVWQCSPVKQRCLNRCHAPAVLAAFGAAADIDALRYGMTHGRWCAGSCWVLMLLPLLLPMPPFWGHVAAMAMASALIASERLEQPAPPRWRVRGAGRAIRIGISVLRCGDVVDARPSPGARVTAGVD